MKKIILIVCLGFITLNAQNKERVLKPFDGIKSSDPKIQMEIDQIRDEFLQKRDAIRNSYKRQVEIIKEQEKDDLRFLKNEFYNRLKELKKLHKDITMPKEKSKINSREKVKKQKMDKSFRKK